MSIYDTQHRRMMAARRKQGREAERFLKGIGKATKKIMKTTTSQKAQKKKVSKKSSKVSSWNVEYQKRLKQHEDEVKQIQKMVDEYQLMVEDIQTIHVVCEDEIMWNALATKEAPFELGTIGPAELYAHTVLEKYQPSLFGRMFKSVEDKKRSELEANIEIARQEDQQAYDSWKNEKDIAEKILRRNTDAYAQVIEEMEPLAPIEEYVTNYNITVLNETCVEVEFGVRFTDVVPDYVLAQTKTGKLSQKAMPKGAHNELVQDHICSLAIRIAREIMSLLPVPCVLVHATDNAIDASTGQREIVNLLSVLFEREIMQRLIFEEIDPSESMTNFTHNMKFTKISGMKPVQRVEL